MGIRQKQNFLDGLARIDNQLKEFDLPLARYVSRYKRNAILFSKSGRTGSFFTEDSKKYLTPDEYRRLRAGRRAGGADRLRERRRRRPEDPAGLRVGGPAALAYPQHALER